MPSDTLRVPFDSVALAAIVTEIRAFVDGKVQGIRQPDGQTVVIELYQDGVGQLLLSADPRFCRAHFVTRRPANTATPLALCAMMRSRLEGARLVGVEQVGNDRILDLQFASPRGAHRLVAELMGRHANLIFLDEDHRILQATKWVKASKSPRAVGPGVPYALPPVLQESASPSSPFFERLKKAGPLVQRVSWVTGAGAYPYSLAALSEVEVERPSLSIALEQHFDALIRDTEAATLRAGLIAQLDRVLLARDTSLKELRQAADAGERAGKWQVMGELLLAYQGAVVAGSEAAEVYDYEGDLLVIPLVAELDPVENAKRYFERARKAKDRLGLIRDQLTRLEEDRARVRDLWERIDRATRLDELRAIQEEARERRYLHQGTQSQGGSAGAGKAERAYQGHRIRELIGPDGIRILVGETATANDYLTTRVARSNDYWLHVRGGTSAHVVIQTQNQPTRVTAAQLKFAANLAADHSPSKHSSLVAVDYTLKKYVRKPKGAAPGTAVYTHEKTLHIER